MKKTLSTLGLATIGLSMLAGPAFAAHEGTAYSGNLTALNGETGSGDAYIEVSEDGNTMSVSVNASNLELDFVHAMHIHGVFTGDLSEAPADSTFSSSACPTVAQDVGDAAGGDPEPDGFVSVIEGAAVYGGVQVSLTTGTADTSPGQALDVANFPSGTSIDYDRDITIPSALKDELAKVHIVVHGTDTDDSGDVNTEADADGNSTKFSTLDQSLPFDATAPALCGTLSAASAGVVDAGAGGAADNGQGGIVLGAGALAFAGAIALRRRGIA